MTGLVERPGDKEELLVPVPETAAPAPSELLKICMPITEQEAVRIAGKLDQLIEQYKDYEYTAQNGEPCLIGNRLWCTEEGIRRKRSDGFSESLEYYPLAEQFRQFYETEVGDYRRMIALEAVMLGFSAEGLKAAEPFYEKLFGQMPLTGAPLRLTYPGQTGALRNVFRWQYLDRKALFETGLQVAAALLPHVRSENKQLEYQTPGWNGRMNDVTRLICDMPLINRYFEGLQSWETDEEFIRAFSLAWRFEARCREGRRRRDFIVPGSYGQQGIPMTGIRPYWFLPAVRRSEKNERRQGSGHRSCESERPGRLCRCDPAEADHGGAAH